MTTELGGDLEIVPAPAPAAHTAMMNPSKVRFLSELLSSWTQRTPTNIPSLQTALNYIEVWDLVKDFQCLPPLFLLNVKPVRKTVELAG